MSVPVTEKTHVEVNKPGAFQEATIERKVEPQPAATVLPTAHTHEPAEQVDEKVLKQRKEQQKHMEKEFEREHKLDEKEVKEHEEERKDVEKADEKAAKAEEKSRKNYEKVKHKYDEALHDLKEAEADLNSKIHEREKLAQQHKLAEMKIGEQKHAMEEHDAAREKALASGPAAGL
ncbi:hypothetical protein JCM8202_000781 [Rhodotorula sphaerocarpa]